MELRQDSVPPRKFFVNEIYAASDALANRTHIGSALIPSLQAVACFLLAGKVRELHLRLILN